MIMFLQSISFDQPLISSIYTVVLDSAAVVCVVAVQVVIETAFLSRITEHSSSSGIKTLFYFGELPYCGSADMTENVSGS